MLDKVEEQIQKYFLCKQNEEESQREVQGGSLTFFNCKQRKGNKTNLHGNYGKKTFNLYDFKGGC